MKRFIRSSESGNQGTEAYKIEYMYEGDDVSPFLGTVIVEADSLEQGIEIAKQYMGGCTRSGAQIYEDSFELAPNGEISSLAEYKQNHPYSNVLIIEKASVKASTYDPDMDNGKGGFKFNIEDKRRELDSRIDWVMHHFDYDDRVNPECDSYKGTSQAIDYANRFITEIQKGSTDSETVRNAVKWTEMAEGMVRKCIQEGEDLGYAEDGFIDDNGGITEPFAGDW